MKKSANDSQRKKGDNVIFDGLPKNFTNALSQNTSAMNYFKTLTDNQRSELINQSGSFSTPNQMKQFIDGLVPGMEV